MDNPDEYRGLVRSRPQLFANPAGAAFEILLRDGEIEAAEAVMATKLENVGAPREWARVGVVFRDQYTMLLRDAVRYTDGSLGTYIRMVNPYPAFTGVVILPIWQESILLISHFRHATRRAHVEIPRGFGSESDPAASAQRELEEEIGASGIVLTRIGNVYPDTGVSDSRVALFYAEITSYAHPESGEGITEIIPTSIPELDRMIGEGVIEDGYLLAAYAQAKARRLL